MRAPLFAALALAVVVTQANAQRAMAVIEAACSREYANIRNPESWEKFFPDCARRKRLEAERAPKDDSFFPPADIVHIKEMSMTPACQNECSFQTEMDARVTFTMTRLKVFPEKGPKQAYLVIREGMCGTAGCESAVLIREKGRMTKLKEALGISIQVAEQIAQTNASSALSSQPSFDCSKANSASARLICADKELSALDGQLAIPFRKKLAALSGAEREAFIGEQRRWINERNAKCGLPASNKAPTDQLLSAKPCMVEALRERIAYLNDNAPSVVQRAPSAPNQDASETKDALVMTSQPVFGDFVVVGVGRSPTEGMYQTLNFQIPSKGLIGNLSCNSKPNYFGIPFENERVILMFIHSDISNSGSFLSDSSVQELLPLLKSTARQECAKHMRTGKLLDFEKMRPLEALPILFAVRAGTPCFFAYTPTKGEEWRVLQNCVVEQRNRLLAQQRSQQEIAQQEQRRADQIRLQIRSGLEAARKEFPQIAENTEARQFVEPVIQVYLGRSITLGPSQTSCGDQYEYVSGSVSGRSIEGTVGVILIKLIVVNKSDIPIETGSPFGRMCGNPSRALQPGERLNMEAKGIFRKYDTGWRFERMLD